MGQSLAPRIASMDRYRILFAPAMTAISLFWVQLILNIVVGLRLICAFSAPVPWSRFSMPLS
jgi:hypothetical protein